MLIIVYIRHIEISRKWRNALCF